MNRIDQAMKVIQRSDFLPIEMKPRAAFDEPLLIGFGATNSQPSTVRQMLKWLDPQPGEKILDVGSGSGWTTALLAHSVGSKGNIYAVERIPQLVRFGEQNCKQAGVQNAQFFESGDVYGLSGSAPYDRILVSAAATALPEVLIDQLKVGGRLVIPIKNSIYAINKQSESIHEDIEHPGYVFVPLV